jgi:hypothetical protein
MVHAAVLLGLLFCSFEPWWLAAWAGRDARAIHVVMAEGSAPAEPEVAVVVEEVRIVTDPSEVTAGMVREKLDEVIDRSKQLPDEEKLQQLDKLSERLTQVSSEASIDSLGQALQGLLGTTPRAQQPAENPSVGGFDYNTAQFHDVKRHPVDGGGYRYLAVLLDAQGRTTEVAMSEEEGQRLYATLERIKANPLLERVYRQIVMPLMDQILAGARKAAESGRRAESREQRAESPEPGTVSGDTP